jgi:hypothetical protein
VLLLSNNAYVIHLPWLWFSLSFSESDHWLWVLLAAKDDEQAACHLGFVFVGELGDLLLFD